MRYIAQLSLLASNLILRVTSSLIFLWQGTNSSLVYIIYMISLYLCYSDKKWKQNYLVVLGLKFKQAMPRALVLMLVFVNNTHSQLEV